MPECRDNYRKRLKRRKREEVKLCRRYGTNPHWIKLYGEKPTRAVQRYRKHRTKRKPIIIVPLKCDDSYLDLWKFLDETRDLTGLGKMPPIEELHE